MRFRFRGLSMTRGQLCRSDRLPPSIGALLSVLSLAGGAAGCADCSVSEHDLTLGDSSDRGGEAQSNDVLDSDEGSDSVDIVDVDVPGDHGPDPEMDTGVDLGVDPAEDPRAETGESSIDESGDACPDERTTEPMVVTSGFYPAVTMCECHFYRVFLECGDSIRAVIVFENELGNLELTLFGTDRSTTLDDSATEEDQEEVVAYVVPESGEYLLWVCGETEDDLTTYDMTIEVFPPVDGYDIIVSRLELASDVIPSGGELELTFVVANLGVEEIPETTIGIVGYETDPPVTLDGPWLETVLLGLPGTGMRRRTISIDYERLDENWEHFAVAGDIFNEIAEVDETNNWAWSGYVEIEPEP